MWKDLFNIFAEVALVGLAFELFILGSENPFVYWIVWISIVVHLLGGMFLFSDRISTSVMVEKLKDKPRQTVRWATHICDVLVAAIIIIGGFWLIGAAYAAVAGRLIWINSVVAFTRNQIRTESNEE